ncbi:MAG: DUF3365 domain-containing protein, partial [Chlorobi bacterium]|nr:DUF3365 domain-containing protein [Chlorobiota bacterium]
MSKDNVISKTMKTNIKIKHYEWPLIVFWTAVFIASWIRNDFEIEERTINSARTQARISLQKDYIYRFWNASHGGVYVPITKKHLPNPYLKIVPERDIETTEGKKLTLVNPAYMTRLTQTLSKTLYGFRGHITSLKPINPGNKADEWETKALLEFEKGKKEVSGEEILDNQEYFRLMTPFVVESSCLKCHGYQNYSIGDIRGGISVSVPMKPFILNSESLGNKILAGHIIIWVIGLIGIVLYTRKLKASDLKRKKAEGKIIKLNNELEEKVKLRTNELEQEKIFTNSILDSIPGVFFAI